MPEWISDYPKSWRETPAAFGIHMETQQVLEGFDHRLQQLEAIVTPGCLSGPEINGLRRSIRNTQARLRRAEETNAANEKELEEMRLRLGELQQSNTRMAREIERLTFELFEAHEELTNYRQREIDRLQGEVDEAHKDLERRSIGRLARFGGLDLDDE